MLSCPHGLWPEPKVVDTVCLQLNAGIRASYIISTLSMKCGRIRTDSSLVKGKWEQIPTCYYCYESCWFNPNDRLVNTPPDHFTLMTSAIHQHFSDVKITRQVVFVIIYDYYWKSSSNSCYVCLYVVLICIHQLTHTSAYFSSIYSYTGWCNSRAVGYPIVACNFISWWPVLKIL